VIHPPFSALLAHSIAAIPHDLVKLISYSLPLLVLGTLDGKVVQDLILMLRPGLLREFLARVHEVPLVETLGLGSPGNHVGNFLPVVVCEVVDSFGLRSAVFDYGESKEVCFFLRPVLLRGRISGSGGLTGISAFSWILNAGKCLLPLLL